MAFGVDLSGDAKRDLASIREWLTQPGAGRKARERLDDIRRAIRELRSAPERWPFGEHEQVRERPAGGGYRLMYRIVSRDPGLVLVIRIFGPYQDRSAL